MRRHKKADVAAPMTGTGPVDVFLAQAPLVENDGEQKAAIKPDELLRGGPDAQAISAPSN